MSQNRFGLCTVLNRTILTNLMLVSFVVVARATDISQHDHNTEVLGESARFYQPLKLKGENEEIDDKLKIKHLSDNDPIMKEKSDIVPTTAPRIILTTTAPIVIVSSRSNQNISPTEKDITMKRRTTMSAHNARSKISEASTTTEEKLYSTTSSTTNPSFYKADKTNETSPNPDTKPKVKRNTASANLYRSHTNPEENEEDGKEESITRRNENPYAERSATEDSTEKMATDFITHEEPNTSYNANSDNGPIMTATTENYQNLINKLFLNQVLESIKDKVMYEDPNVISEDTHQNSAISFDKKLNLQRNGELLVDSLIRRPRIIKKNKTENIIVHYGPRSETASENSERGKEKHVVLNISERRNHIGLIEDRWNHNSRNTTHTSRNVNDFIEENGNSTADLDSSIAEIPNKTQIIKKEIKKECGVSLNLSDFILLNKKGMETSRYEPDTNDFEPPASVSPSVMQNNALNTEESDLPIKTARVDTSYEKYSEDVDSGENTGKYSKVIQKLNQVSHVVLNAVALKGNPSEDSMTEKEKNLKTIYEEKSYKEEDANLIEDQEEITMHMAEKRYVLNQIYDNTINYNCDVEERNEVIVSIPRTDTELDKLNNADYNKNVKLYFIPKNSTYNLTSLIPNLYKSENDQYENRNVLKSSLEFPTIKGLKTYDGNENIVTKMSALKPNGSKMPVGTHNRIKRCVDCVKDLPIQKDSHNYTHKIEILTVDEDISNDVNKSSKLNGKTPAFNSTENNKNAMFETKNSTPIVNSANQHGANNLTYDHILKRLQNCASCGKEENVEVLNPLPVGIGEQFIKSPDFIKAAEITTIIQRDTQNQENMTNNHLNRTKRSAGQDSEKGLHFLMQDVVQNIDRNVVKNGAKDFVENDFQGPIKALNNSLISKGFDKNVGEVIINDISKNSEALESITHKYSELTPLSKKSSNESFYEVSQFDNVSGTLARNYNKNFDLVNNFSKTFADGSNIGPKSSVNSKTQSFIPNFFKQKIFKNIPSSPEQKKKIIGTIAKNYDNYDNRDEETAIKHKGSFYPGLHSFINNGETTNNIVGKNNFANLNIPNHFENVRGISIPDMQEIGNNKFPSITLPTINKLTTTHVNSLKLRDYSLAPSKVANNDMSASNIQNGYTNNIPAMMSNVGVNRGSNIPQFGSGLVPYGINQVNGWTTNLPDGVAQMQQKIVTNSQPDATQMSTTNVGQNNFIANGLIRNMGQGAEQNIQQSIGQGFLQRLGVATPNNGAPNTNQGPNQGFAEKFLSKEILAGLQQELASAQGSLGLIRTSPQQQPPMQFGQNMVLPMRLKRCTECEHNVDSLNDGESEDDELKYSIIMKDSYQPLDHLKTRAI